MAESILFLCTHNSARSQMAEALGRDLAARRGSDVVVHSAGTEARGVHPLAVRAMSEVGLDLSSHRSKTLSEVLGDPSYVITLCSSAAESCPVFPGARRVEHWDLPDPSAAQGSEEQRLAVFRQVRDEIRKRLEEFWARAFPQG
jgi:arsenate reductase